MSTLAEYLISVTGAAIVCSGVCSLLDKSSSTYAVVRMISGIFIAIVMIQPILSLEFEPPWQMASNISIEGSSIASEAYESSQMQIKQTIEENTITYIQNKLNSMQCTLRIDLSFQQEYPYTPIEIQLTGAVSPYTKSYLSGWLEDTIGISTEAQTWIG